MYLKSIIRVALIDPKCFKAQHACSSYIWSKSAFKAGSGQRVRIHRMFNGVSTSRVTTTTTPVSQSWNSKAKQDCKGPTKYSYYLFIYIYINIFVRMCAHTPASELCGARAGDRSRVNVTRRDRMTCCWRDDQQQTDWKLILRMR